ncbi:hypothetical protein FB451DRAFT_468018 [Mycena latifolia]|nr:hypothetical protein FB451DRAFT_468018 [Mycena latifolia]
MACYVSQLPYEVLLIVFHYTLPPSWLLSDTTATSLPPFSHSLMSFDMRMKVNIISVCRTWHQVGIQLLYECVTLRRFTQIPAFIWALESQEGLGALVRSLEIHCFVPPRLLRSHEGHTKQIFQYCPRLAHFSFSPPKEPQGIRAKVSPQRLVPTLSSSITSLRFNAQISYTDTILPILLEVCGRLRSLTLATSFHHCDLIDHPMLNLETLEDLHLSAEVWPSTFRSKWLMPRLRRVWLRPAGDHVFFEPELRRLFLVFLRHAMPFFDSYGGTLTFLSLYGATRQINIQIVLDRCPVLQHLAIEATQLQFSPIPTHPTISIVDLFFSAMDPQSHTVHAIDIITRGFPALRTVRQLDETMSCLSDIPSTLPATHSLDPIVVSDGPGLWIAAVLSAPSPASDAEDSDYDPQASEDGSDSDDTSSGSDRESAISEDDEEQFDFFAYPEDWDE